MTKPSRSELWSALRAGMRLAARLGGNLALPGWARKMLLDWSHRIQRLLIRDRQPPT